MPAVQHLVRDVEGLKRAIGRGLRFYHTVCGSTALMENLVDDPSECGCGTCRTLARKSRESQVPSPESPVAVVPKGMEVDLSDFEALEESRVENPKSRESHEPYPEPDRPPAKELARRLCADPGTDAEGKFGNLPIDIRRSLTDEERKAAGQILAMVGGMPAAEPLMQIVYRLCHRVAWLERVTSHESRVESLPPADGTEQGSEIGTLDSARTRDPGLGTQDSDSLVTRDSGLETQSDDAIPEEDDAAAEE